jgi:hypothetical protein
MPGLPVAQVLAGGDIAIGNVLKATKWYQPVDPCDQCNQDVLRCISNALVGLSYPCDFSPPDPRMYAWSGPSRP